MFEISDAQSYFEYLSQVVHKLPLDEIDRVCDLLLDAYEYDRAVYLFGNGGSAALASHFSCDLGKGTINGSTKRFRVLSLTDNVPLMTAWANDLMYEEIFAQQLANFIQKDDVAFAISGSGNSRNVLNALRIARAASATTIGLTGYQGGEMKSLCDACVIVPCENMQIIEDLHLCVAHALFSTIRKRICTYQLSRFASRGM